MNISIRTCKWELMRFIHGFFPDNSIFHKHADCLFTNSALCDSKDFFISQNLSKIKEAVAYF